MIKTLQNMIQQGEYTKIWEKYCGFLDLKLDDFVKIQERLLMEQIELLSNSGLGKVIMGDNVKPKSINEFRETVPLTTYDDYADILLNKREDMLPEKPKYWIKTTWKGGSHPVKLAPYSERMVNEHVNAFIASLILSTSEKRGDFSLMKCNKFLYGMAPLPYLTGLIPHALMNEIDFEYLPSIEEAETLGFKERNELGFSLGMKKGIDLFFGLSSILVKIGESFANDSKQHKSKIVLPTNPVMIYKLLKALLRKRITKQPMLPKDIWNIKGIVCAGTDTAAYRQKIEYFWGRSPLEIYGGTEIAITATETWERNGLTFFPDTNFLEFIPEKDSIKSLNDKNYKPKTLLINEIQPNERYELVITKLKGGAFIRYRVGDIVKCLSLKNDKYKIDIPQIVFVDRVSNIIDLAGFTRITKTTIDTAVKLSNLEVVNWVACKEYVNDKPILHLYVELKKDYTDTDKVKKIIEQSLSQLDSDFNDIKLMLGIDPLKVTIFQLGTFDKYIKITGKEINNINPDENSLKSLINLK